MTTLAEGVCQIRDGNLDHRIAHAQRDEFQPVCEAFNEMADRLRASVEQSRREEGLRMKEAVREVAEATGLNKNELYAAVLKAE